MYASKFSLEPKGIINTFEEAIPLRVIANHISALYLVNLKIKGIPSGRKFLTPKPFLIVSLDQY